MGFWYWIVNFTKMHPTWMGIIGSIVIGTPPAVWAGHWGNRMTERRNKRSLEAKQQNFMDDLNAATRKYIYSEPNDAEVLSRREFVESKVKELSTKYFGKDYPIIGSFRPENTQYPELPCKWCHRPHKAEGGSHGNCKNCALPLDLWIGTQGQAEHSK